MLTFRPTEGRRALVVGDVMLDRVVEGDVTRLAPEAPVPVLRYRAEAYYPGGAANVAHNLARLGLRCNLLGLVGDDHASINLEHLLRRPQRAPRWSTDSHHSVHFYPCRTPERATTVKTRLTSGGRPLFRLDEEGDCLSLPLPDRSWKPGYDLDKVGAIALVDYSKGALDSNIIRYFVEAARVCRVPVLLDAKPLAGAGWGPLDLVKVNETDFGYLCRQNNLFAQSWESAARQLCDGLGIKKMVITLGKKGLYYFDRESEFSAHHPAVAVNEVDPAGAGDVVTAVLTAALLAGEDVGRMVLPACEAASLAVARPGTCVLNPFELSRYRGQKSPTFKALSSKEEMEDWGWYCHQAGKSVVFTNGCFDLFHAGHLHFLERCREWGDALVVSLNEDDSVHQLKGEGRPVIPFLERVDLVSALPFVDAVACHNSEKMLLDNIKAIRPTHLAKGTEWRERHVVGADFVASHGGAVVFVERYNAETCSTSAIAERVRAVKVTN